MNELAYYLDKYYAEIERRKTSGKQRACSTTAALRAFCKRQDKHHKSLILANKGA